MSSMTPFKTPLEGYLAQQITAERKAAGVTVEELANAAGIGRPALSAYLNGRRDMPLATLVLICQRLGVTVRDLAERAELQASQEARRG